MNAIIITVGHCDLTQTEILRDLIGDNKTSQPIMLVKMLQSGYDFVKLQKHVKIILTEILAMQTTKTDKVQEEELALQFRAKSG